MDNLIEKQNCKGCGLCLDSTRTNAALIYWCVECQAIIREIEGDDAYDYKPKEPQFLTNDFEFVSIYFPGVVKVLSVNELEDKLEVQITPPSGNWWFETWVLSHTKTGFKQFVYLSKPKERSNEHETTN